VEGICEDPAGRPVEGAKVEVTRSARDGSAGATAEVVASLSTDKEGRFDLELLDAQHEIWEYTLRVTSPKHVAGEYPLDEQTRNDRLLRVVLPPL
jgi:5-hydroxyisourate hydrolase-like protein (transthyretin family)